jgi:MFS family permease
MSDISKSRNEVTNDYPSSGYAWYVVVLLTLGYILSFLDRIIINLLVEPIKADFVLTDTQIGLLMGVAFSIFYATMGIPLGWLADNMKRKTLVAAGMFIWSAATCLSGYAKSFAGLFAARIGVGAGEATLSPCAISLISDMFPEEKRARAIALYSSALSIASATAFYIGGKILAWANSTDTSGMFLIDGLKPWQIVFVVVGLPGIILGIFVLFVREPKRQVKREKDESAISFLKTLNYYKNNLGSFLGISLLVGVMTTIAYSQFFSTSLFIRTWGWEASDYAFRNSIGLLLFGPPSVMIAGWLVDKLHKEGVEDAAWKVFKIGFIIMIPPNALFPLMPDPWIALFVSFTGLIGIATVTAAGVPAILKVIPGKIRAQSIAIYYMIISMCGLLIGPTSVGFLADSFGNLQYAMAAVPATFGIIGYCFLPMINRIYLNQIKKEITI